MNQKEPSPAFRQYQADSDWVVVIPWNARLTGQILIGLAIFGALVFAVIQYLDHKLWDVSELVGNVLILGVLIYVGLACLHNQSKVRINSSGNIRLIYGPQPIMPGAKLLREDIEEVRAYWHRSSAGGSTYWRVDLVTHERRWYPLCFGGINSKEEAERLAQTLRDLIQPSSKTATEKQSNTLPAHDSRS